MMTGINPATFWLTNLIWDFSIYLVSSTVMVVFLMAMDSNGTFTTSEAPGKLPSLEEDYVIHENIFTNNTFYFNRKLAYNEVLFLGAFILIVFLHGIPAILLAYLFSFWAKTSASGFSIMTILGVFSGKL